MADTIFIPSHWAKVDTEAQLIAVKLDTMGYFPVWTQAAIEDLNPPGCTEAIMRSALNASMFGWDAPIAKEAREFLTKEKTT